MTCQGGSSLCDGPGTPLCVVRSAGVARRAVEFRIVGCLIGEINHAEFAELLERVMDGNRS